MNTFAMNRKSWSLIKLQVAWYGDAQEVDLFAW